MLELSFLMLFVAALFALVDWRKGLAICVLTALLQDPLRKLAPDQPPYFVLFVGIVFAAALAGAYFSRVRLRAGVMENWHRYLRFPFGAIVVIIVLQGMHSLLRWGNPQMAGIGLLAYMLPVPAVVLAYQFALRGGLADIRRLMWFYAAFSSIWLFSIYLDYLGFDWPVLGEVGQGFVIHLPGIILKVSAGLFRSIEIAAWHTGTTACFLFILIWGRRLSLLRLALIILVTAALVGLGLLTGRRKFLMQLAIFISIYGFLAAWFSRGAAKLAVVSLAAGLIAYASIIGLMDADPGEKAFDSSSLQLRADERYKALVLRGRSVVDDVGDRFDQLGVQPISWAIDGFGWFGAGLGTGSQGTQHVAGTESINRGAAEGGLGKITMELGVPGLLAAIWLAIAFVRHVWLLLHGLARTSQLHAHFAFGLVAFLVSNVAAFSVATQAFGDLFILLMLGWSVGFLLAMPVIASAAAPASRQQIPTTRLRATTPIGPGQPRFMPRAGR